MIFAKYKLVETTAQIHILRSEQRLEETPKHLLAQHRHAGGRNAEVPYNTLLSHRDVEQVIGTAPSPREVRVQLQEVLKRVRRCLESSVLPSRP